MVICWCGNNVHLAVVQQQTYIRWQSNTRNVFSQPLPKNGRLFWLHYSGFQALCHSIYHHRTSQNIDNYRYQNRATNPLFQCSSYPQTALPLGSQISHSLLLSCTDSVIRVSRVSLYSPTWSSPRLRGHRKVNIRCSKYSDSTSLLQVEKFSGPINFGRKKIGVFHRISESIHFPECNS
jgi:hypothetical protein